MDASSRRRPLIIPIGSTLADKYRIESTLGAGGMGVVFAATHLHLNEPVAIKLLRPEVAVRPVAVKRFLREARVAMKLRGEHVVRIFDASRLPDGSPYIVMERLSGKDFGALLRDEGPLPLATAVDYIVQACHGVAEAHAHGVIHRDLKPANLFLTTRPDGSPCVKVLDFGASKILAPSPELDVLSVTTADTSGAHERVSSSRLALADTIEVLSERGITRAGAFVGSPRYMAPEQIRSAHDVDERADVWALGAILHELIRGRPAFDGDSLEALRSLVLDGEAAPLEGVPPALAAVIGRCLAKEPGARFATALELACAVAPFGSEGSHTAASIAPFVSERSAPRQPVWRAASAAIVLGVVVASAFALRSFGRAVASDVARPTGEPFVAAAPPRSSAPADRGGPFVAAGPDFSAASRVDSGPIVAAPSVAAKRDRRPVVRATPVRTVGRAAANGARVDAPTPTPTLADPLHLDRRK